MNKLRVFLSYAREDRLDVAPIYERLRDEGFVPWMDTEDLRPGTRWESSIRAAIKEAHIFLAILSEHSINKRGVIQKEIRVALDVQSEKLDGDIYIVPVRIRPCQIPERLAEFHAADLYAQNGWEKLQESLQTQHAVLFGAEPGTAAIPGRVPKIVPVGSGRSYFNLTGVLPDGRGGLETVEFGISSVELATLAQRGLATGLAQFYALVPAAVAAPSHVFQGLYRPFTMSSREPDDQTLIFVCKPSRDVEWSRVAPAGPRFRTAPGACVFAVMVRPGPIQDASSSFAGTIVHWNWLDEDLDLRGLPAHWRNRYQRLVWPNEP